ncbi:MAG: hypothetical protein COB67_00025 [SAR324 cluster bacterium]|uniref:Uncharacterized protein n=1 Tax=SAR324 cluster bacterium TaxID=2024889 RepID=A0A2A4TB76_9DELT|nr:MAG: hypothetical protein COB67_00025 [SAR324 cluster bacterium]
MLKNCTSCNVAVSEGYTWDDETYVACSEECIVKTGLTQVEVNADINLGSTYWLEFNENKEKQ